MDDFYAARGKIIPPLPWQTFAPPFSLTMAGIPNEERLEEIMMRARQTAQDNIAVCIVSFAAQD